MHESSYNLMKSFVREHLSDKTGLKVCDIGSMNLNGTYKDLFKGHDYTGMDMMPGRNVNVVSEGLYTFPFSNDLFDIVISGQTLEHVKNLHLWIIEIVRITKQKGLVCIIAPMVWKEHKAPIDCWRIFPDGMKFLLEEIGDLEIVKVVKGREKIDCMGIGKKK